MSIDMGKDQGIRPGLFYIIRNLARKCNPVHRGDLCKRLSGPKSGSFSPRAERARTNSPTLRGGPMGDLSPEFSCPGEGAPCCPRGRCHLISG